jgi:hypothetical protein
MKNHNNIFLCFFALLFLLFSCNFGESCKRKYKNVYIIYDLKYEEQYHDKMINNMNNIIDNFFNKNSSYYDETINFIPIQIKEAEQIEPIIFGTDEKEKNRNKKKCKEYIKSIKKVSPLDCDIFLTLERLENVLMNQNNNYDNYVVFLSNMININSEYDFDPSRCEKGLLDNEKKSFLIAKEDDSTILKKYQINSKVNKLYIVNVGIGSTNIKCSQTQINEYWKGYFTNVDNGNYSNAIPDFK